MSSPKPPKPVRPIANFFFTDDALFQKALTLLDEKLGARCFTGEPEPFDLTTYYEPEMGKGIKRAFAAWEKLIDPSEIVEIKLYSWEIEDRLKSGSGDRIVNIDPGLLGEGNLLLATGKKSYHRPYFGKGVYIDLTLIYISGSYRPLPWTYPDYAGEKTIALLNKLRAEYLKDRKDDDKK